MLNQKIILLAALILLVVCCYFVKNRNVYILDTLIVRCPYSEGKTPSKIRAPVNKFAKAKIESFEDRKIPRAIYQTNEYDHVPENMKKEIDNIIKLNPSHTYRYFTGDDCRNYIKENMDEDVLKCYDKLIPGAFKADLFRYCILYKEGGIYLDSCFVLLKPLDTFIKGDDEFISVKDSGYDQGIYNAFMCSIPGHPILKDVIDRCCYNIRNNLYCDSMLSITGPRALGKSFMNYYGIDSLKEGTYPNYVRLLNHTAIDLCKSGFIRDKNKNGIVILTKYPFYKEDMEKYSKNPHYGVLWKQGKVYF